MMHFRILIHTDELPMRDRLLGRAWQYSIDFNYSQDGSGLSEL
jgi:hypothetical protein